MTERTERERSDRLDRSRGRSREGLSSDTNRKGDRDRDRQHQRSRGGHHSPNGSSRRDGERKPRSEHSPNRKNRSSRSPHSSRHTKSGHSPKHSEESSEDLPAEWTDFGGSAHFDEGFGDDGFGLSTSLQGDGDDDVKEEKLEDERPAPPQRARSPQRTRSRNQPSSTSDEQDERPAPPQRTRSRTINRQPSSSKQRSFRGGLGRSKSGIEAGAPPPPARRGLGRAAPSRRQLPVRSRSNDIELFGDNDGDTGRPARRQLPGRSRSNDLVELNTNPARMKRRESMKAMYRLDADSGGEDDGPRRAPPARTASTRGNQIEGAPFGAGLGARSNHSMRDLEADESDPKWLQRRAGRQDEIMNLAHTMKGKAEEERLRKEELERQHDQEAYGDSDLEEDDQPMSMRTKKNALELLGTAISKTAGVTKSAAKGSVNAVRDPKRAAKRVGNLSKDVAKGTVGVIKDPKKAAIKMGNVTKNVTLGSAKVGAGITKGVAKGTFGATKTVVKGSVRATTTVTKGTVKGVVKGTKGTVRAIKGKEKKSKKVATNSYDARNLTDRHQSNFVDRITQMVDEEQAVKNEKPPTLQLKQASVLMPTNIIAGGNKNWDV